MSNVIIAATTSGLGSKIAEPRSERGLAARRLSSRIRGLVSGVAFIAARGVVCLCTVAVAVAACLIGIVLFGLHSGVGRLAGDGNG